MYITRRELRSLVREIFKKTANTKDLSVDSGKEKKANKKTSKTFYELYTEEAYQRAKKAGISNARRGFINKYAYKIDLEQGSPKIFYARYVKGKKLSKLKYKPLDKSAIKRIKAAFPKYFKS